LPDVFGAPLVQHVSQEGLNFSPDSRYPIREKMCGIAEMCVRVHKQEVLHKVEVPVLTFKLLHAFGEAREEGCLPDLMPGTGYRRWDVIEVDIPRFEQKQQAVEVLV